MMLKMTQTWGDSSWGLGLSPRGNLVLKVNLCGTLGGQRSCTFQFTSAWWQACAADWWVLTLSHINCKVQQSDKQTARVFLSIYLTQNPISFIFCKLCFLSVLLGRRESVVRPLPQG